MHTVFVTDDRGCTASDTVFMHNPDLLTIAIDPSQTILPYCEGVKTAQLGAIANGGTLGYILTCGTIMLYYHKLVL